MNYISVKEAAEKWGLTSRMVNYYCANGRIEGTVKISSVWVIPKDAPQPSDRRKRTAKNKADFNFQKEAKNVTYTIGICDDCTQQVDLLAGFLQGCGEYGEFRLIHASEPEAFWETLKTDRLELVFLDVDMDGMNGIELGEKIRALYENTVIIYITGYEKYAYEAFQLRAFHYLLKPVTLEQFRQVLSEALTHIQKEDTGKTDKKISIQNKGELLTLPYRDIYYFEKIGHKIKIRALSREVTYYDNFNSLLAGLEGDAFVQCHQGYIANADKIRAFRDKTLYLDGGIQLPVSRTFAEQVKEVLKKHLFAGRDQL